MLNMVLKTITCNQCFLQLVLTSRATSDVLVEVFDKDVDKDDFLGRYVPVFLLLTKTIKKTLFIEIKLRNKM